MFNTSEVLIRNQSLLREDSLLFVNPPRDSLPMQWQTEGREVWISTQHHGDFHWFEAGGVASSFDVAPAVPQSANSIILTLPREKERLALMVHAISQRMPAGARLLLVGENRAGIKSAPRTLSSFFETVEKLDAARHCGLFQARDPKPAGAFRLENWQSNWDHTFDSRIVHLVSLPGVFAHGRMDQGTAVLMPVLEQLKPAGKILDFACGCGVIACSLLAAGSATEATLLDVSSLALESSRRSLIANQLKGTILPSDGLSDLHDRFDWIISNPPFHQGIGNDLEVARDFFARAGTFLRENGRILIVFNRHLPYTNWINEHFSSVKTLASTNRFSVLLAAEPFTKHRVSPNV